MDETKVFEIFTKEYKEKYGTFYPHGMKDIDESKLVDYISWLEKRSMAHDAVLGDISNCLHTENYSIDDLKCCGNCKYYDVLDNFGSVCYYNNPNEGFPIVHTEICEDWEYDISIKTERKAV